MSEAQAHVPPEGYIPVLAPPHLDVDFYKVGHIHQYPAGTTVVYSNATPRSYHHAINKMNHRVDDCRAVVFGLQMMIKEYLINVWNRDFFHRPWSHVEYEYRESVDTGLNTVLDLSHLKALHACGYLPVEIRALPEGSVVDMKIPVFTIHNTLPEFYWLTNALETVLSNETWKPMVAATIARNYRRTIEHWASITGSPEAMIQWQCHDFSARGMSGRMDSRMCGVAHLTSFTGTDTVAAIHAARLSYGANTRAHFVGGSVPATEHSVMCIDGKDNEFETYCRMLQLYPEGIVSIVSDSYDFWKVMTDFTVRLRPTIMARPGRVVFRPDTGNPADIICGTAFTIDRMVDRYDDNGDWVLETSTGLYYRWASDDECYHVVDCLEVPPEARGAYEILADVFGTTINALGFKDLDSHVGLIYGDSITAPIYEEILSRLAHKGFSPSNLVVGIGSYTYQYVTRDTLGEAVKATFGVVGGTPRTILKDPKTGDGTKKSATGLLRVVEQGGVLVLEDNILDTEENVLSGTFDSGLLQPVFRDGQLLVEQTLSDIRARLGWSDAFQ